MSNVYVVYEEMEKMMSVLLMLAAFVQSPQAVSVTSNVTSQDVSYTVTCYKCTNCEPNNGTKTCIGEVCVKETSRLLGGAFMFSIT